MTPSPDNRPIIELATEGPILYERFLLLATEIARQLQAAHESGRGFGNLGLHSIQIGADGKVLLPPSTEVAAEDAARLYHQDLCQVGKIFAYLLTGGQTDESELTNVPIHPVLSETQPLDNWSMLLPPEAKLLIEQLVSPDPTDRIASAKELAVTLDEMRQMHALPVELAADAKSASTRTYLWIGIAAAALILIWLIVAFVRR